MRLGGYGNRFFFIHEMNISQAKLSDIDAVMSMVGACTRHMESQGIFQWDDKYPTLSVFRQDITDRSLFVMNSQDNTIIGTVVLNDYQDPEYREVAWAYCGERIVTLHRLCVHPDIQGHGVAGRLLEFAENKAYHDGCEAIRLDVYSQNITAVSLYEKGGYRKAGIVEFRKGSFFCFEKNLHSGT